MLNYNMSFGELTFTENKMPILELVIKDENGDTIKNGYLTPFRKYCFQVSGNKKGDGDYGSTACINFDVFKTLPDRALAETLRCMAVAAMAAFANSNYASYNYKTDECANVHVPSGTFTLGSTESPFYKFIKEVYYYLYGYERQWPFID
jgi:hypothetical protein